VLVAAGAGGGGGAGNGTSVAYNWAGTIINNGISFTGSNGEFLHQYQHLNLNLL
jgi:hypothetical protein